MKNHKKVLRQIVTMVMEKSVKGHSFYSGSAGHSWFLFHAGKILKDKNLMRKSIAIARASLKAPHDDEMSISGFYIGRLGQIAVIMKLASIARDEKLLHQSQKIWTKFFIPSFQNVQDSDIFKGWAGSLLAFVSIHDLLPLSERKTQAAYIKGWLDRELPLRGLQTTQLGLAHGLSGIALALARFSKIENWPTGKRLSKTIEKHIDAKFSSKIGGWPRELEQDLAIESWCNGSAGIVLARLNSQSRFNTPEIKKTILERLAKRSIDSETADLTFCHGRLGFLEAYWALKKMGPKLEVNPECTPGHGIMTGLPGLGYALCRTISVGKVPSILTGI